jgi:hypothetical protein
MARSTSRAVRSPRLLKDILRLLGQLRHDRAPGVDDMILWAARTIHELTGIQVADLLIATNRLANGDSLDGCEAGSLLAAYIGERPDVAHVARPLHALDQDGTTDRIWHQLCRRWSFLRDAIKAARPSQPTRNATAPALATKARQQRMTVEEANQEAQRVVRRMGKPFFNLSIREQSRQIGCSFATWKRTPFFETIQREHPPKERKPGSPKTVSLTKAIEEVVGIDVDRDEALEKLCAEQHADREPSPLEPNRPGRRQTHHRKRL